MQVVLDNFNSAPPDVAERLLSLMEDDPSLHLYEHAEGEVLTYANGGIHADFRLLLTACPGRAGANKLSSATRNRAICLQLPAHDAGGRPTLRACVMHAMMASVGV